MESDALIARHETLRLPGGRSIAYRDFPGPPGAETVLLLHGIGMTADLNWAGSFATLHQRLRVVAPDLRGHGRSGVHRPNFASRTARTTWWRWRRRWASNGSSRPAIRWAA